MKTILADKIASVALNKDLHNEVRLSNNITCEEGVLIAVKILNNKSRYNRLELISGRMSSIQEGDVIVGSLGHRDALLGYSGSLPNHLEVGSIVQILNMGGVMGICKSYNPDVGPPFDCEVLGSVLSFPYLGERVGITSRVGLYPYQDSIKIKKFNIPVIAIVDSNNSFDGVDYMIPGNDDSMSSINLFLTEVTKIIKNNRVKKDVKDPKSHSDKSPKTKSLRKKQVIDVEKNKKNTDDELKAHVQDED